MILVTGMVTSYGAVTVQGWWHLDSTQPINDSSGNNRTFGSAYSTAPATGGAMAALLVNNGVGGPLDGTGYTSTQCIQLGIGVGGKRQSAMWGIGYNPPATDYGIEIWAMPQDNGIAGGSGGWIFSSGQGGGVALRINAPGGETPSYIDAFILGTSTTIGSQVPIDTNRWMHLAIVNDNGVLTFYTNGIACGASVTSGATTPAGDCYIGTPGDNQAFYGFLDEARMFTFAPGAFSTSDLLLRPPGPNIVGQPQNAAVWDGGAAPFSVTAAVDASLTYQWQRETANISGATLRKYTLPTVSSADNNATFRCVVTGGGLSVTSSPATLTVVPVNPSDVNAYRNAINAETSLVAYFPVDGDTGTTLANAKDATRNGTLELNASYDGRTDRAFGQRAIAFNADGDVQIPNNPAFEVGAGNGTVEAVIYMNGGTLDDPTIFAEAWDDASPTPYFAYRVSRDGLSLVYVTDSPSQLSWSVAPTLIGRKAHVAFVVQNGTNVTAYVDGLSLGTKSVDSPSYSTGGPAWIGAVGNSFSVNNRWSGTIDELSIYSSALSQNTVQTHYSLYFFGTNTAAPSIVSQSSSRTLFAGASPVLNVKAAGTLPLSYQWTSNNVAIPGATTDSLSLTRATTSFSASYALNVNNAFGSTNSDPIVLTFVAPPAGYISKVMNDGPSAFWRMAESAGPIAADSAGMNDATYSTSGVTYGEPGLPTEGGTAVRFNGSTGRAIAPLSPTLNPAGAFSIEMWIKPENYTPFSNWSVPLSSMDRPARTGGYEFYMGGNYEGLEFHTAAGGGYNGLCGDATKTVPGVWTHVVGICDGGNNIWTYVNGVLKENDNAVAGGFTPNKVVNFFIGSRSDNVRFFNGVVADVALYHYMLTDTQITDHWSAIWAPASITTQPASVTTNEWASLSLTAIVAGVPNTYKWQKNNVDLTDVTNPDGSPHYPNGVTSASLVISQAHPADNGQYRLVVSNPVGGANATPATVTITPDTTKPTVTYAAALPTPDPYGTATPFLVQLTFSELVDPTTVSTVGNYGLSGSVTVSAVTLGADSKSAYLTTSGLTPGQKYTVTINGVKDQAENPNTIAASTTAVVWAPVLTQGLVWDFYPNIQNGVANLQASSYYPYAPYKSLNTTTFDSSAITGGDLNNRPGFTGGLGENYGCSLSGWITPTVTANYYFYLASDDASELYLSSDANPINAVSIATESGCCHGFQEPGNPTTSVAIPLTAGVRYFIRALQTEGGGGDYVRVAWKMENDPTASTNLVAISGSVLSAYAPLPAPQFNKPVLSGNQLSISWTGLGALYESTDLQTWTPVAGNPSSPFVVDITGGPRKFYAVVRE